MVFDYYVDDATCSMVPWEGKVPSFSYMPDSFSSLFVPTVDTTRLTYFLDTLIAKKHYVMFVGNTGGTNCNNWTSLPDVAVHIALLMCSFIGISIFRLPMCACVEHTSCHIHTRNMSAS